MFGLRCHRHLGRIEIVLANSWRVIVDAGVDIVVLSQLVEALERR
jgi:hypothetical protein